MENDVELKSKFSNIFIMLLTGLMENDMTGAKHYISEELFTKYQDRCEKFIKNKEYQCYDEPNVGDINITNRYEDDNYYYIEATLLSRYMDYVIDMDTLKYKRGVNDHRIDTYHHMVFRKRKDAKDRTEVVECPYCGASLDVNYNGKCEFCGKVFSAENYDYILINIDNL